MISYHSLSERDRARMPNLFIIGCAKSGTTSLHSYLGLHPEISVSTSKEPSFFADQNELRKYQLLESMRPEASDLAAYLDLFPDGEQATYRCEASPTYTSFPFFTGVAERIAKASPFARLIFVVRNPVERTISHYWHLRKMLVEDRPIREAVTLDSRYVTISDYSLQLAQYRPYFEDFIVVGSEALRKDPRATLNGIFGELGLCPIAIDLIQLEEKNRTRPVIRQPRFPFVRALRETRPWKIVRNRLNVDQLDAVRRFAVREVPREEDDLRDLREHLADHFEPKVRAFDAEYGLDFHERWFGARPANTSIPSVLQAQGSAA